MRSPETIKVCVEIGADQFCRYRPRWTIGPVSERTTPSVVGAPKPHFRKKDVNVILTDVQQVVLSVSFVDSLGNPATPPPGNVLAWSSSDPTIVSLTDNGDGSMTAVTTGTLGSVVISAADDLEGDGVPDFFGSLAIDVAGGAVTGIVITPGVPVPRP